MEINSNKVFIYPSGYRQYNVEGSESPVNVNPESRLNTEFNIVKSINSLVPTINQGNNTYKDSGSFIVDYSNNVLEFYVHGYWFKIIDFTTPDTDLYASIKLIDRASESADYSNLYELCPILYDTEGKNLDKLVDDGGTSIARFIGLSLDTTPHQSASYTLQLFESGRLCVKNKAKLTTNDVYDETHNTLISDRFNTNIISSSKVSTGGVETNYIITDEINNANIIGSGNTINLFSGNTNATITKSGEVALLDQAQTFSANKLINRDNKFIFSKNVNDSPDSIRISGTKICRYSNTEAGGNFVELVSNTGESSFEKNIVQIKNNGQISLTKTHEEGGQTTLSSETLISNIAIKTNNVEADVARINRLNNINFTTLNNQQKDLVAIDSGDICVTNVAQAFTQPKTRTMSGYISTIFPSESGVALSIANNDNKTTKYGFNKVTFGDGSAISSNGNNTLTIKNKNLSSTSIMVSDGEITISGGGIGNIGLYQKFGTLDGDIYAINNRLDSDDTRMDGIDTRIDGVDAKVPLTTGNQDTPVANIGLYIVNLPTIDAKALIYVSDLRWTSSIKEILLIQNGSLVEFVDIMFLSATQPFLCKHYFNGGSSVEDITTFNWKLLIKG